MTLVLPDRVRDTTLTTGVGPLVLQDNPPATCQPFSEIGDGNTTFYTLLHQAAAKFEVGIGTYDADTNSLDRTVVLASSTGGPVLNLTNGSKTVFVGLPGPILADMIADIAALESGLVAKLDDSQASALGLTLLGAANAGVVRTALNLVPGTDVQAYDAELAAIAGLVSAANKLPYFTGLGTASLADLSAFGRSLIDDADAAAGRTTLGLGTAAVATTGTAAGNVPVLDGGGKLLSSILPAVAITETFIVNSQAAQVALTAERGDVAIRTDLNKSFVLSTDDPTTFANWKELLTPTDAVLSVAGLTGAISAAALRTALSLVIGTDVQAYDAELAALAGLTSAANKLPYFTGAGTAAVTDLSAFARTLLDDADATAARATLGVNTTSAQVDVFTSSGTYTKPAWASTVEVILIGGGGGGGSGVKRANSTGGGRGGGGGGGGGYTRDQFPASALTSTVSVTIGAGGTGGASQATNSTSGNNGTDGGTTSFGAYAYASGGGGGQGGIVSNNSGGSGAAGNGSYPGGSGGGSNPNSPSSGAGAPGSRPSVPSYFAAPGGGSGGGIVDSTIAATGGGPGIRASTAGWPTTRTGSFLTPAQNSITGAATAGADNTSDQWYGGESGDGGAASTSGAAGAGANGGKWGGGAGGGGASINSVGNSGAGGTGGQGIAIIISRA